MSWRNAADELDAMLVGAVRDKVLHNGWYRPERMPADMASMRRWAASGDRAGFDIARYASSRLGRATGKGKARPEHPAFGALEHWSEWQAGKVGVRHAILAEALGWVRQRFAAQKRRRAQIGFDDLLLRLDAALVGPAGGELADTIRRQFPLALIDEFQDTDPLQYRLFRTVYAGAEGIGPLLIGDPKQAIYAFRCADIHTYLTSPPAAPAPPYRLAPNHTPTTGSITCQIR